MENCTKCIIPTSFPNVTFKDGVCSICLNYNHSKKMRKNYLGKDKLLEILTCSQNSDYDCTVPISGGKDSTYVLYSIVRDFKLKPLALFFDNGFTTKYALQNVKKICKKLDVDLVVGESTKFRHKFIKESIYMSKQLGKLLPLCTNCESNLRSFAINETEKRKIPFIIWGSTDFEDSITTFTNTESSTFRESYGRIGNAIRKITGSVQILLGGGNFLNKCRAFIHAPKFLYYVIRDNIEMKVPEGMKKFIPFSEVSFEGKGIKVLYFYDYIQYDPFNSIKILEQEIGWSAPAGKEGKMDCRLAFWKDYDHALKTGLSSSGFTLSVLVRDGKLDRDEALQREKLIKKDLRMECERLGNEFGIDLENILSKI